MASSAAKPAPTTFSSAGRDGNDDDSKQRQAAVKEAFDAMAEEKVPIRIFYFRFFYHHVSLVCTSYAEKICQP